MVEDRPYRRLTCKGLCKGKRHTHLGYGGSDAESDPKTRGLVKQVHQLWIGREPHLLTLGDFRRSVHFSNKRFT